MPVTNYVDDLDIRTNPSAKSVVVVLSDATELQFIDDNGPPEANTQQKYCRGFHANDNGTLCYTDPGDATAKDMFCNKGNFYPYEIGLFRTTGTTAALAVAGAIIARR